MTRIYPKLFSLLIAFTLLPALAISLISFNRYHAAIETIVLAHLNDAADEAAYHLEQFFLKRRKEQEVISVSPVVQAHFRSLNQYADDPAQPDYVRAKEALDSYLKILVMNHPYLDIRLVNAKNKMIYTSHVDLANEIHPSVPYPPLEPSALQAPVVQGRTDDSEPRASIPMEQPVFDASGEFLGRVDFQFDAARLHKYSQRSVLLQKSGEILWGKKWQGDRAVYLTPLKHDPGARFSKTFSLDSATQMPIQRACRGENGFGRAVDYRGTKVLAAWRSLAEQNIGLVVKIDEREALQSVYDLAIFESGFFLTVILLVGWSAAVVARSMIRPIHALTESARILGSGDLSHRVAITSSDEIGQLGQGLNLLADSLKKSTVSMQLLNMETNRRLKAEGLIAEAREKSLEMTEALQLASQEQEASRKILLNVLEDDKKIREELTAERQKEEQLRLSVEMASRAKSEFLANISHEIRTPMNAVIGFSDLLDSTALDKTQREYLQFIRESSAGLLELINDILDISKIEGGNVPPERILFSMVHLVESTVRMVRPRLVGSPITLAYHLEEGIPPQLVGDPTRIRQIALNLLSNAIKFSERGQIAIRVGYRPQGSLSTEPSTQRGMMSLSVKDDGIGIKPEDQKRIFSPFVQADPSTTKRFQGMGLGLAITKQLAESMGGSISLVSEPGRGSVFTVHWEIEVPEASSREPVLIASPETLRGKKVAILDENVIVLGIIDFYCQHWGMKVLLSVSSTRELLTWLSSTAVSPDLIISGMAMPEIEKGALAAHLRTQEKFSNVKLLAIVADPVPGTAMTAQASGYDAYLPKPIFKDHLLMVLRILFSQPGKPKQIVTRHLFEENCFNGLKVLVVEDNPVNSKMAGAMLDRMMCSADFAYNGAEAVEKVRQNDYQIILMDIQMPVMDGFEAAKTIREMGKTFPILAVTGASLEGLEEKMKHSGFSDTLAKPFEQLELRRKIRKWVQL